MVSMKVTRMMSSRVIILAAKNSPPVIRDLRSGVLLLTLSTPDDSFVSVSCLTALEDRVYYCDSIRHVYVFKTGQGKQHSLTKVIDRKFHEKLNLFQGLNRLFSSSSLVLRFSSTRR